VAWRYLREHEDWPGGIVSSFTFKSKNFEKFLIGRNGEVVNRFNHRVKPENEKVVQSIEEELKKK
jgi:glutathione peroxidase-family protein